MNPFTYKIGIPLEYIWITNIVDIILEYGVDLGQEALGCLFDPPLGGIGDDVDVSVSLRLAEELVCDVI